MSRLSIFDTAWTDIVFEGRNQDYGAYQLRKENPRTTMIALATALLLAAAVAMIPLLSSLFGNTTATVVKPDDWGPTVVLRKIAPPMPQLPKKTTVTALPSVSDTPTKKYNYTDPEIVSDPAAAVEAPVNTTNSASSSGMPSGTDGPIAVSPATGTEGTDRGTVVEAPSGPLPMNILDRKPSYPGGKDAFKNAIAKSFNTPEEDFEPGSIVTVELMFVIETDGTMSNIRVVRSSGKSLDAEALRVLRGMKKKWEPGYYKGKAVSVIFRQAINLQVQ